MSATPFVRHPAAALLLMLVAALSPLPAAAGACRGDAVQLRGDWGQARFSVEVADTPAARERGLMHRETMARSAGMLFVYPEAQRVGFWMRNTLIPLDMIFANERGVVRRVHHMARPLDENVIDGGEGIRFVLEINGGLARALGLGEGSEMRHPAIPEQTAAWPC